MNTTKLPKSLLVSLAAPVLLAVAVPAIKAQSQTETKIRLMADGLRARDAGDLATAKTNFEQLLALAPNDVTVQRLLAGVNSQLAQNTQAPAAAPTAPAQQEPVEVAYKPGQPADVSAEASSQAPASASTAASEDVNADAIVKQELARVNALVADSATQRKLARQQAKDGNYDQALATLEATAQSLLPATTLTQKAIDATERDIAQVKLQHSQDLLKQGKVEEAKVALDTYKKDPNANNRLVDAQTSRITRTELSPPLPPIEEASPNFLSDQASIANLLAKGRSQYIAGDLDGAKETFRQLETVQPSSVDAKYFLTRIAKDLASSGKLNREKSREQLLQEVTDAWQRPSVYEERGTRTQTRGVVGEELSKKLDSIIIPSVNFTNLELSRVISTLSAVSEQYDTATSGVRGVNLVLQDTNNQNPKIDITLRNLPLRRILDLIVANRGFEYDVQEDVVVVRPSTDIGLNLNTESFAVTRSTVTRMTGAGGGSSAPAPANPFAEAPSGGGKAGGGESGALRSFLQQAGVNFDEVKGSNLAYDGAAIIVTQTSRNLDRIRAILNRYNEVRQVEIEAKFMEVQEGALDELGVNWSVAQHKYNQPGKTVQDIIAASGNRNLGAAFSAAQASSDGLITQPGMAPIPIVNAPPSFPGGADLAAGALDLAKTTLILGNFDVTATLRALAQKTGNDLLSAPKVTVLSGIPASITIGQELRYPQSYGEIQSQVSSGTGSTTGGGGNGVTITAGTPQDFTSRNVGVELNVTPTVEEDDYSISLELTPKVTEFEGFIEYGGQSVAISGGTTVTVPSGFYQPVFSTREIKTRVTVWDGATIVMGGLTREEVKRVNDKVPVLGDIPGIGRLFQSKGETSSKRNLLVFVTANLVSPGGSPKKQSLKGVEANALFQNPSLVTPAGTDSRSRQ